MHIERLWPVLEAGHVGYKNGRREGTKGFYLYQGRPEIDARVHRLIGRAVDACWWSQAVDPRSAAGQRVGLHEPQDRVAEQVRVVPVVEEERELVKVGGKIFLLSLW